MFSSIEYSKNDNTAMITLNRPSSYNAVTSTMFLELHKAISKADKDEEISIIILTGKGDKAFSAGVDLNEDFLSTGRDTSESLIKYAAPLISLIVNIDKPVLAAVNGLCVGIGTSLALACDLVVMADTSSLDLTFFQLGLMPDGGANWLLVKKLGYNTAFQLVVNSERIKADRALQLGIACKILCHAGFKESLNIYIKSLTRNSLLSMVNTKAVMRKALCGESLEQSLLNESNLQGDCIDSDFFQEKIRKFKG